jgi:hypothetical protein
MASAARQRFDFFLSRRGSVAPIAQEVADVLSETGYRVLVQDYDIPLGASFVEDTCDNISVTTETPVTDGCDRNL